MRGVASLFPKYVACLLVFANQYLMFCLMGEFQTPSLYYNRHHIYNILVPFRTIPRTHAQIPLESKAGGCFRQTIQWQHVGHMLGSYYANQRRCLKFSPKSHEPTLLVHIFLFGGVVHE